MFWQLTAILIVDLTDIIQERQTSVAALESGPRYKPSVQETVTSLSYDNILHEENKTNA